MKNITVSIDDETYRKARMAAAQRDVSLSALVRRFLLSLIEEPPSSMDPKRAQEELLDELWKKYPDFSAQDRVSREEIYKR